MDTQQSRRPGEGGPGTGGRRRTSLTHPAQPTAKGPGTGLLRCLCTFGKCRPAPPLWESGSARSLSGL